MKWPPQYGLSRALQKQVQLSGTRLAVQDGLYSLSFAELHSKAMYLAHQIKAKQAQAESPIGIIVPRGLNHVLAQVAVVYAGGTCVPLDNGQPDEYLGDLLKHLRCNLIITNVENQSRLPEFSRLIADHSLDIDSRYDNGVFYDRPEHCSHIFHTSGTTGRPKAVQVLAQGILNLVMNSPFPYEERQRVAHVGNVSFDAALFEIWTSLLSGAQLIIIPQEVILDPLAFASRLRQDSIGVILLTPALLGVIVDVCPDAFSTVHTLFTGGEAINLQTVRTIFQNGAPTRVVNLYGPTECTVYAISHEIQAEDVQSGHIPLGRPIANMQAVVVDEDLNPVSAGQDGELLLRGCGVAKGYFGQPRKTAEVFIQAPNIQNCRTVGSEYEYYYRTGDLVRVNEAGVYSFVGRRDNQVKIRGQRVELEAIEHVLLNTSLVTAAAALKANSQGLMNSSFLLAYVVLASADVEISQVTQAFVQKAPQLMVPRLQPVQQLPMRNTGKVDRAKLQQGYLEDLTHKSATVKPIHGPVSDDFQSIQDKLSQLWLQVLGVPSTRLSPSDDFLALGGTSLQVASLVAKVQQTFQVDIKSAAIYELPTLGALTQKVMMLRQDDDCDEKQWQGLEASWLEDSKLGAQLIPNAGSIPDWQRAGEGKVFMTGATGFVGAFFLAELIRMRSVTKVACLVRAAQVGTGRERILRNLQKYQLYLNPKEEEKILAVSGDFALPQLGLSADDYQHYASWASVVFHLGAQVNYVQPYSSLRTANVLGSLEILNFSKEQRPKTLHYMSSLGVYGPSGFVVGATEILEHERPFDYRKALRYDTGYSQSQMMAEAVMWNAIDSGLPVTIYRPGFVLGHSKTGVTNPDDFVGRLISCCVSMGCYPSLLAQRKEFIPVDFVVSSMLHIASFQENLGQAYNLIQPNSGDSIDMMDTFSIIRDLAPVPMVEIPYEEWVQSLASKPQDALKPLIPMLQEKVVGNLTRWEVQENMPAYGRSNLRRAIRDCHSFHATKQTTLPFDLYLRYWVPDHVNDIRTKPTSTHDIPGKRAPRVQLEVMEAHWEDLQRAKEDGTVEIDGSSLALGHVIAVAKHDCRPNLTSEQTTIENVNASMSVLDKLLARGDPIYGVNTGFGGSADSRTDKVAALQKSLLQLLQSGILSGTGNSGISSDSRVSDDSMPVDWVKAAMLIRANTVARGHSAVSLPVIRAILKLLQANVTPVVPLRGTISASGDLMPLAYVVGALEGNPGINVYLGRAPQHRAVTAQQALKMIGTEGVALRPKEGLGLVNGTASSAALASLVLYEAHQLCLVSQLVTAMAVEALLGSTESFHPFIAEVRPHEGQVEAATNILCLLRRSRLARANAKPGQLTDLVQDRYAIRTASQWIGPQLEDLLLADRQLRIELNSTSDNPLIDTTAEMSYTGGNFQAVSITSAMEKTRLSLQMLGKLQFAQCTEMIDPNLNNGLPTNLSADDPSLSFTMKGVDINMAAYMSELAYLANPISSHVQTAEMHNQAVNSLAFLSARFSMQAVEIVSMMAACSLYVACQALDLRVFQLNFFRIMPDILRSTVHDAFLELLSSQQITELVQHLLDKIPKFWSTVSRMDIGDRCRHVVDMALPTVMSALLSNQTNSCRDSCALNAIEHWQTTTTAALESAHRSMLAQFCSAQDTANHLGAGTKLVYVAIRHQLGVPFHRGFVEHPSASHIGSDKLDGRDKRTIGAWISIIYEALRGDGLTETFLSCMKQETGL